jgi:hypothetical protein
VHRGRPASFAAAFHHVCSSSGIDRSSPTRSDFHFSPFFCFGLERLFEELLLLTDNVSMLSILFSENPLSFPLKKSLRARRCCSILRFSGLTAEAIFGTVVHFGFVPAFFRLLFGGLMAAFAASFMFW